MNVVIKKVSGLRLIVGFVCFLAYSASAAQWFVATTGNNSNRGSIDSPWRTIRHGLLQMAPGDTLNIRGGQYPDDGFLIQEFKNGPSASSPTRVQAYAGERVLYTPHVIGEYSSHGILFKANTNIVLSGIELDARYCTSDGIKLTGGSRNITLTNVTVYGCPRGMGILTTGIDGEEGLIMNSQISNCRVITNGWAATTNDNPLHQIYIQTSGMTVDGCYIQGPTNVGGGTVGIHYFGYGANDATFRNNYLTNCSQGIFAGSTGGSNCWIYNNIVGGCFSWGISVFLMNNVYVLNNTCYTNAANISVESCTNVWVENNIAVGAYGGYVGGIDINASQGVSLQNNIGYANYCLFGTRGTDLAIRKGSAVRTLSGNKLEVTGDWGQTQTNALSFDVKFINAPGGDFRIAKGSDAIGAGRPQSLFQEDNRGNPRVASSWDVGALKFLTPSKGVRSEGTD